MQLGVEHVTRYTYARPARRVIQLLRLTPASFAGQNVLDWRIDVDCDVRLREARDGYGNITHMLYADGALDRLTITVSGKVLTENRAGVVQGVAGDLPNQVFLRPTPLTEPDEALSSLASDLVTGGGTVLERLHRLNALIYGHMNFDTSRTDSGTTAPQAWAEGHGVCQDFTHIFLATARAAGIPARYVSGHLYRRDGQVAQEAGHAWAEAWVEHLGWVAFDPSNGISADDAYVRVAAALDYRDAAPISGTRSGGGGEALSVEVHVRLAQSQSQSQGGPGRSQAQSQSQS